VVMDPHTGRVLAMVGGFSYAQSEFNRATQAMRQPGSSFKPIVYAAALDNGYTPASVIMDGPVTIRIGNETWTPKNYDGRAAGPSTLRMGIERSRNLMTVRLANDMGMKIVSEYAERFGVYDHLPPHIAMSLGSGETTVMRMVSAYSVMANGGRQIKPSLIDRIQDRYGKTVFKHDERGCESCVATGWADQPEPELVDNAEQVLDPMTAYQITSMMEGVVPLGKGVTGGGLAAPIFKEFMKQALEGTPTVDFRVPDGMKLIAINRKTGMQAHEGDGGTIMEAFKPGTGPADSFSVIGMDSTMAPEEILKTSPQANQAVQTGTPGLF
jgi:penicillin-binding protein 1A